MFKLKSLFLCLAALALLGGLGAQVPMWMWANGGGGSGYDACNDIVCDSQGNFYVTGYFQDAAGFGDAVVTSAGGYDIYVAKLDGEGDWEWVATAGGYGLDTGCAITVDGADNLYVAGGFNASANFGSTTLTSVGGQDVFIAKLDTQGNWLWAKKAGWTAYDIAYEIDADQQGNVYVTGWFTNSGQFGDIFITGGGNEDMFLAKLDSYGNWLWAINAPGPEWGGGEGLYVSETGFPYVSGAFMGAAQFGGTTLTSAGNKDIFIAKADRDGNWLWAKSAGATGEDYGFGICVDHGSHLYLTGIFQEYAIFGQIPVAGNGSYEGYVAKADSLGNWLWVQSMGGSDADCGNGICIDAQGNPVLTGLYSASAEFGEVTLNSLGDYDLFAAKLDPNGVWVWAKSAGGPYRDYGWDIIQDSNGCSYIAGYFTGSFGFDGLVMDGAGQTDALVAALNVEVGNDDDANAPSLAVKTLTAWPNPCRGATTLKAALAEQEALGWGDARFDIFDIKGRQVRTLAACQTSPGTFSAEWDGRDIHGQPCPNGVYLTRLSAGGEILRSGKATLAK